MAKRYIDYYAVMDILDKPIQEIQRNCLSRPITKLEEIMSATLMTLQTKIYQLPAADVVEVVYCSQCEHSQYDSMFHKWYCNGRKIQADGYCHLAERRTDEQDLSE